MQAVSRSEHPVMIENGRTAEGSSAKECLQQQLSYEGKLVGLSGDAVDDALSVGWSWLLS